VLAEEFAVAGGEYILCRRGGTQDVSKPVYVAAFEIDTGEQRRRDARLTIAQELPGLAGALNVSSEQDDSGWLYMREKSPEPRCHARAIKTNDHQLTKIGVLAKL
jgi:hypothetical protein